MELLSQLHEFGPYALNRKQKASVHLQALQALTAHHFANSEPYRRILKLLGYNLNEIRSAAEIPFIPVRLFKELELLSVPRPEVVKTMTSSGTSGQSVSRIFLDRATTTAQTKVLVRTMSPIFGSKRLPMLVIDSRAILKDRNTFSARGAGILGFSMFGSDVEYALDDSMQLDIPRIEAFLEKHAGEPTLLFGFTFMIWEHFWSPLSRAGIRLPLDNGILLHGGGWKKLAELAVDNDTFKRSIGEVTGVSRVFNYYGMVEQTGSIFVECEEGHLHASIYADAIIRDHRDFRELPAGNEGLIQLLSLLPFSYPGHSILTEDRGRILGEDDCACGRLGKRIEILGRIKNAEIRGCSDAYASAA